MLFHVIVKKENEFLGRYALKTQKIFGTLITEGILICKKAAGIDLPAKYFPKVVKALGKNFYEECEALHKKRAYPWRIGYWIGKRGRYSFWVESLTDPDFVIIKRSGHINVSTNGKLDTQFYLPLRDVVPLIKSGEFPLNEDSIEVKVEDMEDYPFNTFNS